MNIRDKELHEPTSLSSHIQRSKMGDLDDYDFSTGDAGASNVYNMEAGQIRVGGLVLYCSSKSYSNFIKISRLIVSSIRI